VKILIPFAVCGYPQISAPQNKYGAAKKLVDFLKKDVHYEVDEKAQNVLLSDQGVKDCEKVGPPDRLGRGIWLGVRCSGVR
jgi:preprotein translocase subunit SecA